MSAKAVIVFCAQALLIQSVFSQFIGRGIDGFGPFGYAGRGLAGPALGYEGCGRGLAFPAMDFTPTSGGALPVTSGSAVAPTGISVVSENAYEGILAVAGELPFVGTTAVEGVLPTAGAGAISHGCGNGVNAMTALSETATPASVATGGVPAPYGPALAAPAIASAYTPAVAAYGTGLPYGAPGIAAATYGPVVDNVCTPFDIDDIEITPTSGGALPVASASAIPPIGLSVASETAYEGPLAVAGELPFVGTVAVEGVLPTAGAGAVNHACGNGVNAMVSDSTAFAPGYPAFAPGYMGGIPARTGLGYPAGFAGRGFGCGCAI